MINWNCTREESQIVSKIVDRYQESHYELGIPKVYQRPRMDLIMDIEATHCNGNPLKLRELLESENFNFLHDMIGIQRNLNRQTGKLENCFVPRYSAN